VVEDASRGPAGPLLGLMGIWRSLSGKNLRRCGSLPRPQRDALGGRARGHLKLEIEVPQTWPACEEEDTSKVMIGLRFCDV
jgi:hypothetical protein